ncbi:hypothetical protein GBAR_LOCUS3374 [Geodia barretti]|uniref:Uncharacterized protein n=1 Tax=Geodia barretti TaxID=519541 RepID=A0AA35R340_GEOBA|nr:hypothetical protein GBAR_LOCUS3374 [Geodia barretti]
MWWRPTGAAR